MAKGRWRTSKLKAENVQLKSKIDAIAKKSAEYQNSMSELVAGLTSEAQTNLTSFNPIVTNNIYAPLTINWMALMYMYKSQGVIQTAIDVPVLDALRGGLELESGGELDSDDIQLVEDALDENGIYQAVQDSFIWARLFGGGALIINVEGQNYEDPLDEENIDGKIEFYDACRWELGAEQRIPNSGVYDFYGEKVHASRVLTIVGKRAPYLIRYQLADWGMSEIERMVEDFNGYIRNKNAIYELLDEAKVDVYMLEGLNSQLGNSVATAKTRQRIAMINQLKSFSNALMLDKKDSYEQKQIGFSGMAEMMKENRINIASALRMPMTKLFGLSASGFNSGEDDIENYNAMVESEVRTPMRKVIKKVIRMVVRSLHGDDFQLNFKYRPLRMTTATDDENIKTSKYTRFSNLVDRGFMTSDEFKDVCQKEGLVPVALKGDGVMAQQLSAQDEAQAPAAFADTGKEPSPNAFPGDPSKVVKGTPDHA